jgi:hypothetical protein
MRLLRPFLVVVVAISLVFFAVSPALATHSPIGILTLATHAHLEEAAAFPGLSVFEGERLSTEADGRLGVRAGHSILTLGAHTEVELISIDGGMHVDMSAGSMHFAAAENEVVEVHAGDALVRPASRQPTQGLVTMLGPKVLQITAEHGGLNFSYHEEFRNLPEGQTYRIYLDTPAEPADGANVGAEKASIPTKVTYFIVGAGVAGVAAWGIHDALRPGSLPISPAKP